MKQPVNIPPSSNPRVPAPTAPFYHSVPLQIRFNDIDMLGHVNNGVYLSFLDLGKARYFNDVMGENIDWHNIKVAVVNLNVNFYAPTYLDSDICVVTAVTAITERALTMEQRIIDTTSGEVKCMAVTIMAGFDVKTATSQPIDPAWRAAIEAWEQHTF